MEPVVQLRGAVTLLGRFPALAGIDLEVAAGEIVLLRGPNGAGKTTLLRLLRRPPAPSPAARPRCSATTSGDDRRGPAPAVGLLGHATGLYDDLTVADNVRFWGPAAGADRPTSRPRSTAAGSTAASPDLPVAGRLSAGQRRRTSLACLVARRPELWLLDEPHAGLDHEGRDLVDGLVPRPSAAGATVCSPRTSSIGPRRSPTGWSHDRRRHPVSADPASVVPEEPSLFRDAAPRGGQGPPHRAALAGDLQQVAPFAVLVLILFGVALDPDRGSSSGPAPACSGSRCCSAACWPSSGRSRSRPPTAGATRSPVGPRPGRHLPRQGGAIVVQLVALEVVLAIGVVVMYGTEVTGVPLLVATCVAATAGWPRRHAVRRARRRPRVRETLLPILLLPVLAPVLIGATKAFEAALGGVATDGWPWCGLLVTFALLYTTFGTLAFGTLLEES